MAQQTLADLAGIKVRRGDNVEDLQEVRVGTPSAYTTIWQNAEPWMIDASERYSIPLSNLKEAVEGWAEVKYTFVPNEQGKYISFHQNISGSFEGKIIDTGIPTDKKVGFLCVGKPEISDGAFPFYTQRNGTWDYNYGIILPNYIGDNSWVRTSKTIKAGEVTKVEYNYKNDYAVKIGDEKVVDLTLEKITGLNIHIMASSQLYTDGRAANNARCASRLILVVMTEGTDVVRAYVPYMVNGEPCVYELIENQIVRPSGSGTFVVDYA